METDTLAEAVRTSPLGRGLGRDERARLTALARRRTLATDEVWCREGQPTPGIGIVRGGRLALRLTVPERGPVTVLTVEPGDLVGWSAIVSPHRSTSTAVALEPTEILEFEASGLRAALDADPELAAAIHPRVLAAVSRRLEGTRVQLLDLFRSPGGDPW